MDYLFARPIRPDEELDFVPLYRLRLDLLGIHQQNWDRDLLGAIRAKYPGKLGESFYVPDWATPLLKRYLNRRRGYHLPPIGHLILNHFLGITLPEALEASDGKLWLCPNPVTSCGRAVAHIPRLVRKNVQVSCQKCGFVAMIDKSSPLGTKPQFYSILQRGDAFDAHLRKLHRQGVPVTEIRQRFGLSKNKAYSIMGALRGKETYPAPLSEIFERKREEHRGIYRASMRAHPKASRTQLYAMLRPTARWLIRHDPEWYRQNSPRSLHLDFKGKGRPKRGAG